MKRFSYYLGLIVGIVLFPLFVTYYILYSIIKEHKAG